MKSPKLHVLFCDDSPHYGGAQVAMLQLVRRMSNKKKVLISCMVSNDNQFLINGINKVPSINLIIGNTASKYNIVTNFLKYNDYKLVKKKVAKIKPDYIIINHPGIENGMIYLRSARQLNIPYVNWMHNPFCFSDFIKTNAFFKQAMNSFRDWFANNYVLPLYTHTVTVSNYAKKYLEMRVGYKTVISVLPTPAPEKLTPKSYEKRTSLLEWKGKSQLIGVLGRVSFVDKGQDIFIKAASLLHKEKHDYKYIIVGDGADTDALKALIFSLDLSSVFFFYGWSNNPEDVLSDIDLLVIPSRFESQGLVLLEGMVAKKKIVASDIPVFRECLNPSQLFVSNDGVDLANKIKQQMDVDMLEIEQEYKYILNSNNYEDWVESFLSFLKNTDS